MSRIHALSIGYTSFQKPIPALPVSMQNRSAANLDEFTRNPLRKFRGNIKLKKFGCEAFTNLPEIAIIYHG
jgi:hypothetical protein